MKKLLSVFLALVMVFALCGGALAAEGTVDTDAPTDTTGETPTDPATDEAPAEPEGDLAGKIVILHTNDVHGAITTYDKVAAMKADYEARGAEVLLFDAGDYIQGDPTVSISQGATAVELMNLAGYDLAGVGNHEFDYGYANLVTILESAQFPVVCANASRNGSSVFTANTVFTLEDGTTIGVFGLATPETATKAHPAKLDGVTFLAGEELYACAEEQVAALEAQGVDYVVCLGHLGIDAESAPNRSVDLLANVDGIDLFIDSHSHSTLADIMAVTNNTGKVGDTVVTSTGTKGEYVGVVTIDPAAGTITAENVALAEYTGSIPAVAARIAEIQAEVDAEYGATFATSEVDLNGERAPGNRTGETNLGDLIADAFRWYALEQGDLGVDEDHVVALTNGGGIRASVAAGDITATDILTVLPFGNEVAYVNVTGEVLLEALEASTYCTPEEVGAFPQVAGIEFTVDTTKAYDQGEQYPGSTYYGPNSINRVTINSINGQPFDPEANYVVVTNDFLAAGGDTYYAFSVSVSRSTGKLMDEAVVEYITEELGGTVTVEQYGEPQGRITITTEPAEPGFFTDVAEGAWYYDYIVAAYENGLMTGVSETEFAPDVAVTRAMLVAMVYQLEGSPEVEGAASELFTDVADDAWYADALVWCSANGLLEGFEGETFDADTVITREDVAVMLYAYELYNGAEEVTDAELTWADASDVSEDAVAAVAYCTESGLMNGVTETEFAPDGSATRAQCATVLVRLFEAASEEAAA